MHGRSVQTGGEVWSVSRKGGVGARPGVMVAWLLVAGLLWGACTGESGSPQGGAGGAQGPVPVAGSGASAGLTGNRPAVVRSARIHPTPLTRREPISVVVEAEDPDGGAVALGYQWYVNGEALEGQTGPTLSPELVERSDEVSVEVTPSDAKGAGTPYRTAEALVANTPPRVTRIVYKPSPVQVGDRVTAMPESEDPDGDNVSYQYRWFHNGEEYLRADYDALETDEFTRGDRIVLEVTPSDGIDVGEVRRSDPVMIENSPPHITSQPPRAMVDGKFSYQVSATDRDGDELRFSLDAAPSGMTIDPRTGALEWTIAGNVTGTHEVRIAVHDGHVTDPTVQEFTLALNPRAGES